MRRLAVARHKRAHDDGHHKQGGEGNRVAGLRKIESEFGFRKKIVHANHTDD